MKADQKEKVIMKYSITVNEINGTNENLKAMVSVTLGDSFKLGNIAIYNHPDKGLFVSMPSYKTNQVDEQGKDVYKDIFNPITSEFHDVLYKNILDAYTELHENQADRSYTVKVNEHDTTMPDFSLRVTPFEKEGSSIKGLCSVVFDNSLAVNNISVHQGKDDKLFVSMPSYKSNEVNEQGKTIYKDICYPVTAKFREKLFNAVLDGYEKAKELVLSQQKESVTGKLEKNKAAVEKNEDAKANAPAKEKEAKAKEAER